MCVSSVCVVTPSCSPYTSCSSTSRETGRPSAAGTSGSRFPSRSTVPCRPSPRPGAWPTTEAEGSGTWRSQCSRAGADGRGCGPAARRTSPASRHSRWRRNRGRARCRRRCSAGQHDDRRLEAGLVSASRPTAVDVGQADIHDQEVDRSVLVSATARAAVSASDTSNSS